MSSLDAAQRRLEDALKRVEAATNLRPRTVTVAAGESEEAALERALAQIGAERDALSENVIRLRDECGRLSEALDAAHRDNSALRRVNEEVARRLDGTIDELQQLLDA